MISIVSISGGLGSAEALRRVIEKRGKENVRAVFADVRGMGESHYWRDPILRFSDQLTHERYGGESRDTYRFLWELSHHFDMPIERLEDGRTIFNIMAKKRAFRLWVGHGFVHFCSMELKKRVIRDWIQVNYSPGEYEIVLGMGWDESNRVEDAQKFWRDALAWDVNVYSPMSESPFIDNCDIQKWAEKSGLTVPQSYYDGFSHNNCNNGCIAAGLTHFATLYNTKLETYLYWAEIERSLQKHWGKYNTILKITREGYTYPISLYEFIPFIKSGEYSKTDWGACGCFAPNIQLSMFDLNEVAS